MPQWRILYVVGPLVIHNGLSKISVADGAGVEMLVIQEIMSDREVNNKWAAKTFERLYLYENQIDDSSRLCKLSGRW